MRKDGWAQGLLERLTVSKKRYETEKERPRDGDAIKQWLVGNLATHLEVDAETIDPKRSFVEHGLDSLDTIRFTDQIGEWLGLEFDEVLLYQYQSIDALALYLAEKLGLQEPVL
jgi:acyl carrier protein